LNDPQDDTFHKWAEDQPKWVQDALYENTEDAKSVARVIDLYKVDQGITTKKRGTEDKVQQLQSQRNVLQRLS
jgi:hypothetical protein